MRAVIGLLPARRVPTEELPDRCPVDGVLTKIAAFLYPWQFGRVDPCARSLPVDACKQRNAALLMSMMGDISGNPTP
jgi:hypothetical protein